jgi:ribosomal protein L11 methyltransferase
VTLRRVAVRVPAAALEPTLGVLLELVPGGLEQIDRGEDVELAAYVDEEGERALVAAFPDARAEPVAAGWEDAWRAFHRPARAGGVWIGPPWETPPPGEPAVVIDPGRAFGTGAHATTRLCVELLARIAPAPLLDVGCGSGVLALAAARLGFGPLVAVDDDPIAVEATIANARVNGVELEARLRDATVDPLPRTEVAVANVLLRPVETILARLDARIAVTSGYLGGERPAHPGWVAVDRLEADGWAADRFERLVQPSAVGPLSTGLQSPR